MEPPTTASPLLATAGINSALLQELPWLSLDTHLTQSDDSDALTPSINISVSVSQLFTHHVKITDNHHKTLLSAIEVSEKLLLHSNNAESAFFRQHLRLDSQPRNEPIASGAYNNHHTAMLVHHLLAYRVVDVLLWMTSRPKAKPKKRPQHPTPSLDGCKMVSTSLRSLNTF